MRKIYIKKYIRISRRGGAGTATRGSFYSWRYSYLPGMRRKSLPELEKC